MLSSNQIVYIVDDDDAVRKSLCLLMKSVGLLAQGLASAQEFLEAYDRAQPGCLVLDIRMPGMSGLELQDRLVAERIELPIIFITGHGDVPMAVQALHKGAMEFLEKPFRDQDLIDRVQFALQRDAEQRHAASLREILEAKLVTLTPREREVMERVADGQANKAIAIDLDMSSRTVEIHRARAMEKMGARSLAELVRMVVDINHV
ncbi:MAG: response regulator transcription factor [Gammaproteobacteria bacterium]|nr:response regulator transcription factor [Gammaproteobacteria bacterium]MDH3466819.1 response regulator transcription factor [Gammaproteobacteria bacterium]